MSTLKVEQISKSFHHHQILNQVSFELGASGIYGLLGRNGMGKSTLFKIMTNQIFADAGQVKFANMDIRKQPELAARLFLMSETDLYPNSMRVQQALDWTNKFYDHFDQVFATKLLDQFGLAPHQRIGHLSTGYRTIFKLIVALCVPADFIFLDEPVLGLDANYRDLFYQALIESYTQRPRTFVIATHLIGEIEHLIDHVFILAHGELLVNQSTESLLEQSHAVSGPAKVVDDYTENVRVIGSDRLGGLKVVYVLGDLDETKILPDVVKLEKVALQELFIHLTTTEVAVNDN
ncbi:multidrug ABC transporter ATP-binding protein [Loigolactobacillus backii]|uniref:Multidrug ABC transporter ATP-binding protein n=1 Tax=Loigolactobacillus backii TaxID=375175 RepID=A0A192H3R2_9LACO|nr:ABC transporter ATP-binding protein [Loigolactobacillus backii]ANK62898.1 multidrug ABC transporter ATP-binding protein [Loigolactobacillus backii]ANK70094.1 multidrug ABC transporter ATP-binding protein [Loigolactobacillus backii]